MRHGSQAIGWLSECVYSPRGRSEIDPHVNEPRDGFNNALTMQLHQRRRYVGCHDLT